MTTARPLAQARFPLRSVMSVALLIGAAQTAAFAHDAGMHEAGSEGRIQAQLSKGNSARAVELGEAAVAKAPQDASLRAELGHAYLRAGRFESAATALGDAVALGNTTDHTILNLALAQIACGQNRAALATLDHGANVAPADLGLALALAGDPGRGVAVLADAVRNGSASPHFRQNLAYAYALDGRWADATLTAGFDAPPDQVDARMQQWAQSMQPGGERVRIARLLGVPVTVDGGMPAQLALNEVRPDSAPAPAAPVVTAQTAAAGQLPPMPAVAVADPMIPTAVATADPLPLPTVAAAVDPAPPAAPTTAIVDTPSQSSAAAAGLALAHRLGAQAHGASPNSAHFVQLAAYHSLRSALLGKVILAKRHPLLRGHGLLITEMKVHGRSYWRVVLSGFDGATASSMCASLKRHGAACFAFSVKPGRQVQSMALAPAPAAGFPIHRRR